MNASNLDPSLVFLSASQLVEHAGMLDAVHTRTVKCIARLQSDVDKRKAAIASRWSGGHHGMALSDVSRIVANEERAAILEIRAAADKELDGLLKEAGASSAPLLACRTFYDSPVKVLNRLTLGDAKRSAYQSQLDSVGPAELFHVAQFAISTKNAPLAAAIVTKLDSMPTAQRPFGAAAIAAVMSLDEYHRGSQAIAIGDQMLQRVVIAVRTWRAGKGNPLNTVSLALSGRKLDMSVLESLENDDG